MQNKKISISLVASFLLATNLYSNELYISSATKSEQSIKDVTSNVEVITSDDIEERHFSDVIDAISSISGINFNSNGGIGNRKTIYLRGIDSTRILILIDGIRLNDPSNTQDGSPLHHVLLENIERIEIVKGPQSGIWGADATGGVINIITKKNKSGTTVKLYSEYGSFNTRKFGINLGHSEKSFDITTYYDLLKSDSFSAYSKYGTDLDNYEDDSYENQTYGLNLTYRLNDSNKINSSFKKINSFVNTDSSSADVLLRTYDYDTKVFNTSYNFKNETYEGDIYFNYSFFDRNYKSSPTSDSYYESTLKEFGQKNRINYFDNSYIVFGLDFKEFDVKKPVDNTYDNTGIFISNTNKITDLVLTQVLRYDNYSAFDNKITGKLGAKYHITNDLDVSANTSTGYNVPTMSQLYSSNGDENLKPETTTSYDLNLDYKNFKLSLYKTRIKDLLKYDKDISKYSNFDGISTFTGYEISYLKNLTNDILINLSYDRVIAQDNKNITLERIPNDTFKLSLDYYGLKRFHFNINGQYIGDRIEYKYGTYDIDASTGNYTVWNSVINYDINKNLKTYLKIDNLFDKYYQTVDGYSTSPRAFYVGLKATF